jgi:hypothetical protein
MSMPQMDPPPEEGGINPVSIFMVVDLPAPLGPKKPTISPVGILKLIEFTAVCLP